MNARNGASRLRNRPAQAIVEFVLLAPILLLLLMGIVEIARALNLKHIVTDAAREGARHAVVQDPSITHDSVAGAILVALSRVGVPAAVAEIDFDTSPPPSGHWRETGAIQTVYVAVPYQFGFLGPIIGAATGSSSITIAARISMRNE